jgi:hypothetical protein
VVAVSSKNPPPGFAGTAEYGQAGAGLTSAA